MHPIIPLDGARVNAEEWKDAVPVSAEIKQLTPNKVFAWIDQKNDAVYFCAQGLSMQFNISEITSFTTAESGMDSDRGDRYTIKEFYVSTVHRQNILLLNAGIEFDYRLDEIRQKTGLATQ